VQRPVGAAGMDAGDRAGPAPAGECWIAAAGREAEAFETRVRAGPYHQECEEFEQPMTNSREHSQEELRRQILAETTIRAPENISTTADIERRHNAPIQTALPNEASDYEWKRETGDVQSYQHTHAGSWLHIDPQGQFYDRQAQPITRETALEQAAKLRLTH
jgi:hypothetical protein